MQWWMATSGLQLQLLGLSFVLCALIGIERQYRQKAAGFRTHVLVGTGATAFTLVSAYGFETLLSPDVTLDPSRIAAQIVTGIGFLGAGVIFTRRDVVRGLTTAATIWVAAAVGMAAGAGMVSLAIGLTGVHLLTLVVLGPLAALLPNRDSNRIVRMVYVDGAGVLRRVLAEASATGFATYILANRRREDSDLVELEVRFKGRAPLNTLLPALHDIDGVKIIEVRRDDDDDDEDEPEQ
ncbi:MgtC/SapB family protein [Leucobacter salsicius]|uniref:MgtC/SapB family protein n=1 Tax=Leucobacter salsicius TaxID=664638 RepID=UPI000349EFF3|nr:MgtC/SapB family protein [Leucobacter salsicius]